MATVSTTKPLIHVQLAEELGDFWSLSISESNGVYTATAEVPQERLEAVVAAHVPVDKDGNRRTLEERAQQALAVNAAYLALATPTQAQAGAQVKALTRQVQALIRLQLGQLDATE